MSAVERWKKIRKAVLERDKYICGRCGKNCGKYPSVHHRDYSGLWYGNPLANNNLDNLITLCRRCHTLRHWEDARRLGLNSLFRHNDPEQIKPPDWPKTFNISLISPKYIYSDKVIDKDAFESIKKTELKKKDYQFFLKKRIVRPRYFSNI